MREATVAGSLVVDMIGYFVRHGARLETVCEESGIDPGMLNRPQERVPGSKVERLWATGESLCGDPDLGLHTAEASNPGALDIVGYVILSCQTAGEALDRFARYAGILNEGLRVRIRTGRSRTACHLEAVRNLDNYINRQPRQAMETVAAGIVLGLRSMTGGQVEPRAISFRHAAPRLTTEHARIFGRAPAFGQQENRLIFSTADLGSPLRSGNPMLLKALEEHADARIAQYESHGPQSCRVMNRLVERINGAAPSLEQIAVDLASSVRQLQRDLQAEGTTFQKLLDEVRRDMATAHLRVQGRSAEDVAFLLGYSEASAFTRAFRRWTGTTPGVWRTRLGG